MINYFSKFKKLFVRKKKKYLYIPIPYMYSKVKKEKNVSWIIICQSSDAQFNAPMESGVC
jgi:hypothetical protein